MPSTTFPAGRYTLNAQKAAYLSTNYGAKRPGRPGTTMIVVEGQQLNNIRMTLPKGAVIAGFVRLPNGEPMPDTQVIAVPSSQATAGGRSMTGSTFRTDDRGAYRIFGLTPGEYLVGALPAVGRGDAQIRSALDYDEAVRALAQQASRPGQTAATTDAPPPPDAPTFGYAPTYYPGTPVVTNASMVTVGAGDVREGVDIPVELVRVSRITGIVLGVDGQPTRAVQMSIDVVGPPLPLAAALAARVTRPGTDGRFTITNVSPGAYRLNARGGGVTFGENSMSVRSEQQTEWAVADIQAFGDDIEGVTLRLQPGLTFSGRFTAAGSTDAPTTWKGARVLLQPAPSAGPASDGMLISGGSDRTSLLDEDGSFEVTGLRPAEYKLVVTLPQAIADTWSIKSVMANGRELRDSPMFIEQNSIRDVTVILTDQPATLNGSLLSASGQAATDYYVILFPTDRTLWHSQSPRIRVMRPAADGGFSAGDLLPGDYRIAALTDVEDDEWHRASFLESLLDSSIAVTIVEGQAVRQDVRIR